MHAVSLTGDLVSKDLCGLDTCGHLEVDEQVCFYARLPVSWTYITTYLNHTAGAADADLYGFLVEDKVSSQYPRGGNVGAVFSDESTAPRSTTFSIADAKALNLESADSAHTNPC